MNIKQLLIEKERVAYIQGNVALAAFFSDTLDYIIGLEETINQKDLLLEEKENADLLGGSVKVQKED